MNELFGGKSPVPSILAAAFTKSQEPKLEHYIDAKEPEHKHRWHIKMGGKIVAASTQGYASLQGAQLNLKRIMQHLIELDKKGELG